MRILFIITLTLFLGTNLFAGVKKGKGEVMIGSNSLEHFKRYIRGNKQQRPLAFILSSNGNWSWYWYCPMMKSCRAGNYMPTIRKCEEETGVECGLFARRYTIVWKNGINPGKGKASTIRMKWSDAEIKSKLTELGFLGSSQSSISTSSTPKITKKTNESNDSISQLQDLKDLLEAGALTQEEYEKAKKKINKKTKKVVKKYELKGERSIAFSWDGYQDLIAGTVRFDEADYKGTLNLSLPNNDGTCAGTYLLQKGGKGTWQIACTNNMGAAGTLKWTDNGGVTGLGRDYSDKKVKFTVSKKI